MHGKLELTGAVGFETNGGAPIPENTQGPGDNRLLV